MGKIGIIIWREYLSRIKNRTFIIMCFVLPLLIGGLFFTTQKLKEEPDALRTIVVVDASGIPDSIGYAYVLHDTMNLHVNYDYVYRPLDEVKKKFKDSSEVSILWIPENFMGADTTGRYGVGIAVKLVSTKDPGFNTVNLIQNILSAEMQRDNMKMNHISQKAIALSLKKIVVANEVNGAISDGGIKSVVGLVFGLIIYMYILMFGVQIMRSVVEEKMTRIVEVIISSVKPFQLMLGKIIGVTMVGLTQFVIWLILSSIIILPIVNSVNNKNLDFTQAQPHQMKTAVVSNDQNNAVISIDPTERTQEAVATLMSIPWGNLIPAFLIYFLFGYFLYASIFAAIGSAADVDADTQQFTFPVTIPLIISMVSSGIVLNDPNGTIAHWLSMIPFTSPIVMLMRIPFGGVGVGELFMSMGILLVTFLFFTWIAGKIYRVGILMYGKKASWKQLGKWIFYKG
jgi:ABC-2 type transport system permease protein